MKRKYIAPELGLVTVAEDDVMSASPLETTWLEFDSTAIVDEVDQYLDGRTSREGSVPFFK